jgi:hypothetical protein
METPNATALSDHLRELGLDKRSIQRVFRTFNAEAPVFREQSDKHDQ